MTTIHLGYEVGTGRSVEIPVRHLAVTGQTQESGKTTTLEALIHRSGLRAIVFVTKRGESSFAEGRRIQPYFRDRADWQFVDQLLEAQLREKNKFLRSWIIRICRDTKTLADVHERVRKALPKAKGISEGVYTQLDAYLDLIVPEIAKARLATAISLQHGLNVMDVSGYSTPMQMLFVQSAIDWINAHEEGVITVIPEAWEFIPEGKGSPVKASAEALVRKGAGLKNYVWVDSQDMAGVSKIILRGCAVWLIGVQREANEIKRNLANIPADIKRPKPADIAALEKGQFYACFGRETIKTYVQPAWLIDADARSVAMGKVPPIPMYMATSVPNRPKLPHFAPQEEKTVTEAEAQELRQENTRLKDSHRRLEERIRHLESLLDPPKAVTRESYDELPDGPPPGAGGFELSYQYVKRRLQEDAPALLKVALEKPEFEIEITRPTITADGQSLRGWIARLIAGGFFKSNVSGGAVQAEMARRGYNANPGNLYKELQALALMGFLTIEEGKDAQSRVRKEYRAVPDMKVNIIEK